MLLKCYTHYASKLENSAVVKGLEKVSFHPNPREGQCQRMLKCESVSHSVVSDTWTVACNTRTVAHQAPMSMGFSRQGHWSG